MPMKVEAAVVTQKQASAAFNTDSININGKIFPREVIRNGYKGSGVVSGNVYFALTSSDVEGFADATVAAFNERAKKFPVTRDPKNIFSGFFEDCRGALLKMDREEDELVSGCIYASGRKVTLAGNGKTGLYACRFGACSPVTSEKAENTVADYNLAVISDVSEGDIYIIASPGVTEVLSDKDIEDVCKVADGSVKRIVNLISKVALANGSNNAVSVIAVKVLETALEDDLSLAGFMPDFAAMEKNLFGEAEEVQTSDKKEAENIEENDALTQSLSSEDAADIYAEKDTSAEIIVDAEETAETVPEAAEDETAEETANEEYAEDAVMPDSSQETDTDKSKSYKKTRILLFTILGIMFTVSVVLIVLIFAELFSEQKQENETTTEIQEETTLEETSADEETTEELSSEEESTEEEAATNEEETTRTAPVNTPAPSVNTTRPQETTRAPAAETTEAPSAETTQEPSSEVQTSDESTKEATEETEPSSEEAEPSAEETEPESQGEELQETNASEEV